MNIITRNYYLKEKGPYTREEEKFLIDFCVEYLKNLDPNNKFYSEKIDGSLAPLSIRCIEKYEKKYNVKLKW